MADPPRCPPNDLLRRRFVKLLDWIWRVEGSLALPPGVGADEAYARLDPILQEPGTTLERDGDRLRYVKIDPVAQDKLATFERGELAVEPGNGGLVLRWRLASRALLACFLAPLLFLGFAQLNIAVGKYEKAKAEAAEKAPGAKKKDEKKDEEVKPLHPIDKFLGAPEPEKPKKDDKKEKEEDKKFSPTPAYVFAGIFAALYVIGRILEPWLVTRRFRRRIWGEDVQTEGPPAPGALGPSPQS